ncbi:MAG: transposase [Sulfitobacter sp.]
MSNDRHHRIPGATYFFTIRLADRHSDLLLRRIDLLRHAMRQTLDRHPFHIDAITVLPATIYMLCTLPPQDDAFRTRISMLKSRFSRACTMPAHRSLAQIRRGEKGIWQRRYWDHAIRDADDFARHRDLIYLSPVHAGLCPRPQDWAHTSLHRDLRKGNGTLLAPEYRADANDRRHSSTAPKRAPVKQNAKTQLGNHLVM